MPGIFRCLKDLNVLSSPASPTSLDRALDLCVSLGQHKNRAGFITPLERVICMPRTLETRSFEFNRIKSAAKHFTSYHS